MRNNRRGVSAWLVTWEHFADQNVPDRRVAAVLNSRWSGERVREHVEMVFALTHYSAGEKLAFMKNPNAIPYRAEIADTRRGPQIACGPDPYVLARKVTDLRESDQPNAIDGLIWREILRGDGRLPGDDLLAPKGQQ